MNILYILWSKQKNILINNFKVSQSIDILKWYKYSTFSMKFSNANMNHVSTSNFYRMKFYLSYARGCQIKLSLIELWIKIDARGNIKVKFVWVQDNHSGIYNFVTFNAVLDCIIEYWWSFNYLGKVFFLIKKKN